MKHIRLAVVSALLAAASVDASANSITVDFERIWNGGNGDIAEYYNGGRAGSSQDTETGPKRGIEFVNVSGINNDPAFPVYTGAPSPVGTAYAEGPGAYINIAGGVSGFSFFYSSFVPVVGAVKAYSGINGTGSLLGTLDLVANDFASVYDTFSFAALPFQGLARSFDVSGLASGDNTALFDDVAVVPEPGILLLIATGGVVALARRRRGAR